MRYNLIKSIHDICVNGHLLRFECKEHSIKKDNIYSQPKKHVDRFVFDENVAHVFDDMITRSVPGYAAIVSMIGVMAQNHVKDGTVCYDLGCSLGATTLAMCSNITEKNCRVVSVDNSEAMIVRCRENLQKVSSGVSVDLQCCDIQDVEIKNASMVVLNFTLQFIDRKRRQDMIDKIYKGLNPGGILVLSEKLEFVDLDENEFQVKMHHQFKKLQGYSDLEIAQKRTALEKVLIADSLQEHQNRLSSSGFSKSFVWFQCFNFISMVAYK